MKKIILMLCAAAAATASLSAEQAPPAAPAPAVKTPVVLTLQDCLRKVKRQSPAVLALGFDLEALDRRARAARASYLPLLTAQGQAGYVTGGSTSFFSVIGVTDAEVLRNQIETIRSYRSGGGQISMPLVKEGSFFGLNTPPAAEVKKQEKEIARHGGKVTEQEVLFTVARMYLEVMVARHKLELLDRQRKVSSLQLEMVKSKLPYGLAMQEEVDKAALAMSQNEIAYETAVDLAVGSFLRLSMMLNMDDPKSFSIDTSYPPMPKLPTFQAMVDLVGNGHPLVLQQEAVVQRAKAQLGFDQGRIWPTVTAQGAYTYADDFNPPGSDLWTGFILVNAPIFDFGALHQTAKASLSSFRAESLRVAQVRDDVQQQLYEAYLGIRDSAHKAASINMQIATAEKEVRRVDVLKSMGAITMKESTETEQEYISQRLQQEDATLQHMLSYAQLQVASGGKWEWLPDRVETAKPEP